MAGVIQVKLVEGELRAQIGAHWFLIGCFWDYEGHQPEDIPFGAKAHRIHEVLDDFFTSNYSTSEYLYYWYYLVDHI